MEMMDNTDVEIPNPDCKSKLAINYKLVPQM